MPVYSDTLSDLKKTTVHFDFLLTIAYIKVKEIPEHQRDCAICQEPFKTNAWKMGEITNSPVKLECDHVFGIQCLAHLVFSADFSNRCPLCRAPVIPESFEKNPSGQSWKIAVPILRMLMMFGKDLATFTRKSSLDLLQNGLEKEGLILPVAGKHMDRIMILYEEFLYQFCDQPPPRGNADRLAAAEARVRDLRGVMRERVDLDRELEESRRLVRLREGMARIKLERELERVRDELRAVKDELREVREQLQEVGKKERGFEKELQGVKKELGEVEEKARKELEQAKNAGLYFRKGLEAAKQESNEALGKALKDSAESMRSAKQESNAAMEKVLKDSEESMRVLKAKASAWFISSLALLFALAWLHL